MLSQYLPVLIVFILGSVIAGSIILLSHIVSPRIKDRVKQQVYESGISPQMDARLRYPIRFYIVAMMFVLFDVEVIFMYPWAVVYNQFLSQGAFIFWEMVKPTDQPGDLADACYCRNCLVQFAEERNLQYPDSLRSTGQYARYIRAYHLPDWIDSKCALITSMVGELTSELRKVNPEMKFNLHAVPWRKEDYNGAASRIAGQDLSDLAPLVDFISPMCYTHMLFRDPEWVDSLVIDFQAQGVEKVLPCIQVSESYLEDPFAKEEFCACIQQSLKHQDNGIVFWSWEKLEQDSTKKQCVKEIVFE